MKTQKSWLLLFGVLLCLYFPQVLAQTTNSQLTEEVTKNESGTKSTENPPNVEKTTAVGNHSELLGENSTVRIILLKIRMVSSLFKTVKIIFPIRSQSNRVQLTVGLRSSCFLTMNAPTV